MRSAFSARRLSADEPCGDVAFLVLSGAQAGWETGLHGEVVPLLLPHRAADSFPRLNAALSHGRAPVGGRGGGAEVLSW